MYAEQFPKGTQVKIANRSALEEFLRSWKHHHELVNEQLAYAGRVAEVQWVGFYHGGDVLYQLRNVPGIWHQHLLSKADQ